MIDLTNYLSSRGFDNIEEHSYWWTLILNGEIVSIMKTNDNRYFTLSYGGNIIARRCTLRYLLHFLLCLKEV